MIDPQYKKIEEELNAYDDAIVRATDVKGSLEFAEEKGEARGRLEGELEKARAIAQKLLDVLDVEIIAQKTGLSVEEVEELKNDQSAV